ncbi:MAG: glycerol-3-phosphate 1-O-acyltransferase PlsY [Lachnospiraceae bacterium]|nr:glycerol-3-phosphate 1-O-acyltransferase PlsY [Lachnospiraceae bacterium]
MTNPVVARILCVVIGYCFGLIQTSYILGKIKGIDIRQYGSGNAGLTNSLRVMGKKAAAIVFIVDAAKAVIAMLICAALFKTEYPHLAEMFKMYAGMGVILGHNFPFYMKFKGGKGIMATGGICIGMGLTYFITCGITFFGIFFATHYVSLGSLCMYICFVITTIVCGQMGQFGGGMMPQSNLIEMYVIAVFLAAMAFYRHRANIGRLASGTERKTYLTKKNKVDVPSETEKEPDKEPEAPTEEIKEKEGE